MLAMQLATASILPMALKTAVELDHLEIIAKAGSRAYVTPTELASMLSSNPDAPPMLDRILRVLACHSVLKCKHTEVENGQVERTYGLAPVCKYLTNNEDVCLWHLFRSCTRIEFFWRAGNVFSPLLFTKFSITPLPLRWSLHHFHNFCL